MIGTVDYNIQFTKENSPMKKIMSLMLGLSLLSGVAAFAADKDTTKSTAKSTAKKHKVAGKKKHADKMTTSGNK